MIAVSLNVGGGVRLTKTAIQYMCMQKHYKRDRDGRTAPSVRGHSSVPLNHLGNVVTRIKLQQKRKICVLYTSENVKKNSRFGLFYIKIVCSIRRIFQVFTIYELEMLKRLQFWNNLLLKDIPSVDYSIKISCIRAISVIFSFVLFHMLRYSTTF